MYHGKHRAKVVSLWLFIITLAWTSAPAMGDLVIDVFFGGLNSSFKADGETGGTFHAFGASYFTSSTGVVTSSEGYVERVAGGDPSLWGKAKFDWEMDPGSSAFNLDLTLSDIDRTNKTANASGVLEVKDVDGDVIWGVVTGSWTEINGVATFTGGVSPLFVQNTSLDGTFDGNYKGHFSTDFSMVPNMLGATTDLSTHTGWFPLEGFSGVRSSVTSQVIPVPGAALLAVLGFGLVPWFKRRFG